MDHVDHSVLHPNGSIAHQKWSQDICLHVAVAYCNPYRFAARQALFNDFRRHMASMPNVRLYVGEIAYGERPFEVTSTDNPLDFQWRTREVLWHKENLLNQVIARFDRDWKYGAYVDGDMHFSRLDLGLEAIHQLQIYDWVQLFSTLTDLDPKHRPLRAMRSFAHSFILNGCVNGARTGADDSGTGVRGVGCTGGAWAFRRESFNACGGLLDTCILGSGDWHMSYGLVGEDVQHPEMQFCGKEYVASIRTWQRRAAAALRRNVGVVDCAAQHFWHSSRERRGYGERWKLLRDNDYDPRADLFRDAGGIYQLETQRIRLRDDIRRYFVSRNEDDLQLFAGDRHLAR